MSLARGAARGAAWNFASVLVERGAGFLVLALLMRVVPARDVGLIAIASAISELARVVANSGAGEQVQADPGNMQVEAGAFWSQLIASVGFMLALWVAAPLVTGLYHLPALTPVLRVLALSVVMTCFLIVPSARLTSQFRFRAIGLISFCSTVLGGLCALPLAFADHGIAALVAQRLVGVGVYAVAASWAAGWVPPRPPSLAVLREGFRFSLPLMEAAFVDFISVTGYVMLVGLRMPVAALAQFRIAQRLVDVLQEVAFQPVRKLFMPVLVALRGDAARRGDALRQMLEPLAVLICFVSAVSGAAARPIILLMFGAKWAAAIPVFAILALAVPVLALYGVINPLLTSMGKTRLVSWYAWANALSIAAVCWLAAPYGLGALAWALAGRGFVGMLLFLLALRHGLQGALVWPMLRLLALPVVGMAGARLAAYGMACWLPPLGLLVDLIALFGSATLAYAVIITALAPGRTKKMALRVGRALFARRAML